MRICVYCGSALTIGEPYMSEMERLGAEIGKRGHSLVFGGFDTALMGAVAKGVKENGGEVIGVIPGKPEHFPNRPVFDNTLTIVANGLSDRKVRMEELADGFIAGPGSYGTLDEFYGLISGMKLMGNPRPAALYNINGFYDTLATLDRRMVDDGFMTEEVASLFITTGDLDEILDHMEAGYVPRS